MYQIDKYLESYQAYFVGDGFFKRVAVDFHTYFCYEINN